jgi:small GTP-binding protein
MVIKGTKVYKIVIAGEGGSGKSTLLNRIKYKEYITEKITIGANFHTYIHTYQNQQFMYAIWDFAGEERFRFMLKDYMKGAHAFLLCFDQSRYKTFMKLDDWVNTLDIQHKNIIKALIGTKMDLQPESRNVHASHQVTPQVTVQSSIETDMAAWCERNQFVYSISTSAKTGANVDAIFDRLSAQFLERENGAAVDPLLVKKREIVSVPEVLEK